MSAAPFKEQIIERQINKWKSIVHHPSKEQAELKKPIITLSRAYGSGGTEIARKVAEELNYEYIDREMIQYVARNANVQNEIVASIDEKDLTVIESWIEGLLKAKIFDRSDYNHHLLQVVTALAIKGGCLFIGRGINFVLANTPNSFHCRIVAPLDFRIKEIAKRKDIDPASAKKEILDIDQSRISFIKKFYHRDINDPTAYSVIYNTAFLPKDFIIQSIKVHVQKLTQLHAIKMKSS